VACEDTLELRVATEVQNEANLESRRTKVVEELGCVCGVNGIPSLYFDYHSRFHDHVGRIPADGDAVENDLKGNLALYRQARLPQYDSETIRINSLEGHAFSGQSGGVRPSIRVKAVHRPERKGIRPWSVIIPLLP
jgi:hypothetical protein